MSSNEPIRVLNLFTIMNRGGAETMCMNLYRNIDRTKVQFDFLVYHSEHGVYEEEIEKLGGHIYRIPHINHPISHIKAAKDFFEKHTEYNIVHNHMQSNGALICSVAKKAGIQTIVYHSHSGPIPIITGHLKLTLRRMLNYCLNRVALNSCTDHLACGKNAASAVPIKYHPKILNNAIDLKHFEYNIKTRNKKRKEFNCENKFIIGNVARFDPNKNQSFSIDVLNELLKIMPDSQLWLIGDGVSRASMESKVKSLGMEGKVLFLGVRSDVNELLQAMDVYLFPSIKEGLPVACIEAQAAGLPCVFSDSFDPATIVTDNCQVVSLDASPKKWAKVIASLYSFDREDTTNRLRSEGYDISKTSKVIEQFYLSKVNNQS